MSLHTLTYWRPFNAMTYYLTSWCTRVMTSCHTFGRYTTFWRHDVLFDFMTNMYFSTSCHTFSVVFCEWWMLKEGISLPQDFLKIVTQMRLSGIYECHNGYCIHRVYMQDICSNLRWWHTQAKHVTPNIFSHISLNTSSLFYICGDI